MSSHPNLSLKKEKKQQNRCFSTHLSDLTFLWHSYVFCSYGQSFGVPRSKSMWGSVVAWRQSLVYLGVQAEQPAQGGFTDHWNRATILSGRSLFLKKIQSQECLDRLEMQKKHKNQKKVLTQSLLNCVSMFQQLVQGSGKPELEW